MAELIVVTGDDELVFKLETADPEASARAVLRDALQHMESSARLQAPQRTGNLARSISKEGPVSIGPGSYEGSVSTGIDAPYARFVHEGTGIHGPKHQPIEALPGNIMTFIGDGRRIFTRKTRGQKPNPFMDRAYVETRDAYLPARVAKETERLGNI